MDAVHLVDKAGLDGLFGGPLFEVLDGLVAFLLDGEDLAEEGLCWGFVEVLEGGFAEEFLVLIEKVEEALELLAAVVQGFSEAGLEGCPEFLENLSGGWFFCFPGSFLCQLCYVAWNF